MKTRITELLEIDHPIVQGGMMWAVTAEMASAVSNAGGKEGLDSGERDHGIWTAGMVMGLINDIPTCKEPVDRIMDEAHRIIEARLSAMTGA